MRPDSRPHDALRPVSIVRNFTKFAEGSVFVSFGDTQVVCTATVDAQVPSFLRDKCSGWITAEYAMLPRSSPQRVLRDAVKKGRALEISRLIGRSLRSVVDLDAFGERQVIIDCDVLQADGGTRTASITGAYVALHDALNALAVKGLLARSPIRAQCAAVSVGIVDGEMLLDLCYEEDFKAEVDMNLVMRSDGAIIEIQGCAERQAFSKSTMDQMVALAEKGIRDLIRIQNEVLGCA
jgi:ribonuclease PH